MMTRKELKGGYWIDFPSQGDLNSGRSRQQLRNLIFSMLVGLLCGWWWQSVVGGMASALLAWVLFGWALFFAEEIQNVSFMLFAIADKLERLEKQTVRDKCPHCQLEVDECPHCHLDLPAPPSKT